MSVRRFGAATSREAMRQVRAALGDDALILANRQVEGGVEILAMSEQDLEQQAGSGMSHGAAPDERGAEDVAIATRAPRVAAPAVVSADVSSADTASTGTAPADTASDFAALGQRLLSEMQDVRELLGRRDPGHDASPTERCRQRLEWRLRAAGVGYRLSDELLAALPDEVVTDAEADTWLTRQLCARIKVSATDDDLFDAGGVVALVGPTGVGKTTTTAKLAARYVMHHGGEGVALVTTDDYRVGAQDQLAVYAELLGIEMHALAAERPLASLFDELAGKRLVIVDTVGMSQRDRRLLAQIGQLHGGRRPVRLVLLLNAASQGETLEEVVTTYRRAAASVGARLDDAILTKHDEAARLGPLLDTVIRHGLRLHFVSLGQRVPEDLARVDGDTLVRQALELNDESPFAAPPGPVAPARVAQGEGLLGQGRALSTAWELLGRHVPAFDRLRDAWALGAMSQADQRRHLDDWYATPSAPQAVTLLWARRARVAGEDWSMPDLTLDARGLPLPTPFPHHRQGAGLTGRLAWALDRLGVAAHLLPTPPDGEARRWLAAQGIPWLACAQGNSRVHYRHERQALASLADEAEPYRRHEIRYRGQDVRVVTRRLVLPETALGGLDERTDEQGDGPLCAWFGELYGLDGGTRLGRRYWLAPAGLAAADALVALLDRLRLDELPALSRQAARRLTDDGPSGLDSELRVLLAAGLAALAVQIELAEDDWAMDLRAQLLSLVGGRRRRRGRVLLEALIRLFGARDAMRRFADDGREGDR